MDWAKKAYNLLSSPIQSFYSQYEHVAAPMFFISGVTYDTLTITRIDRLFDNLILLGYLLILGVLIVIVGWIRKDRVDSEVLERYEHVYPLILQFLLGGLFSAYAIYYFRSISFSVGTFFFLVLVGLLVANEFLRNRLMNLRLLIGLYLFVCFSFLVYFIPVITGTMGPAIFYTSIGLSLLPVGIVLALIYGRHYSRGWREITSMVVLIVVMMGSFVTAYRMNWIPPVPLSMEEGGVYHNVERAGEVYRLTYVKSDWYEFWRTYDDPFYLRKGDRVHCFASVFAPVQLETSVEHEWQVWRGDGNGWVTTDVIQYRIRGGRAGGYRGHSFKKNVRPGQWRVNVKTVHGRLLGRIPFDVKESPGRTLAFKTINR